MIDKEPKKKEYDRFLSLIDCTFFVLWILFLRKEVSTIWLLVYAVSTIITLITSMELIPDYKSIQLFTREFEIINYVCFFIPACVYKLSLLSHKILMDAYKPLLNLITFIVYLVFIIYQRVRISNKKVMYYVFFFVYCTSVIFRFLPNDCQQAILDIVFKEPGIYAGIVDESLFFPAIKEAILAFIILDVAIESSKENR